jgi:predicted lipoprotein
VLSNGVMVARDVSAGTAGATACRLALAAVMLVACKSNDGGGTGGAGGSGGSSGSGGTAGATGGSTGGSGGAGGSGGSPGADAAPGAPTRAAVTAALASCSLDLYRAFLPAADALAAATSTLATASAAEETVRTTVARDAWTEAMRRWEEVDLHQYGPLGLSATSAGGKDLRDQIYAWPLGTRCFIEQELVAQRYKQPNFATQTLPNVRGLGTLEYLLFYGGTDNECAATAPINASGSWMALAADPAELGRRKRDYAAAVAADIARRAHELVDAWEPDKGNFLGQFARAGSAGSVYPSSQAALNGQAWALFYLDNAAKDLKLARTLGLRDCTTMPCPQLLESRFAKQSKDNLLRNLDGFEKLVFGCSAGATSPTALGMDDLLTAGGAGDLATRLQARVTAARAALTAMPDDLSAALTTSPAPVMAAHDAIKALCDLMKTELYSVLNIELPAGIPMDND